MDHSLGGGSERKGEAADGLRENPERVVAPVCGKAQYNGPGGTPERLLVWIEWQV